MRFLADVFLQTGRSRSIHVEVLLDDLVVAVEAQVVGDGAVGALGSHLVGVVADQAEILGAVGIGGLLLWVGKSLATGWLVLGESVSSVGLFGILLVVIGSWLLNFEQAERLTLRTLTAPFRAILRNRGARLMLGAAAIYALTSVGGKAAMQWMPPSQFGAFYFALLGLLTLGVVAVARPAALRIGRFGTLPVLLVAGSMALMVVTHFMALSKVEAAYMIAAKRTSLLFGILYGAMLFGEAHLGRHLLAGTLMVAGVAAIAL